MLCIPFRRRQFHVRTKSVHQCRECKGAHDEPDRRGKSIKALSSALVDIVKHCQRGLGGTGEDLSSLMREHWVLVP